MWPHARLLFVFVVLLSVLLGLNQCLGNFSRPHCGFFFFPYNTQGVTGEKENSTLFTFCLHKESLAGDKNRFQAP